MAKVLIKESVADFDAAEENLEKVRSFVRDRLIETPLAKKDITGLLLAVEETVSNIIRHGYLFGPGNIRVRVAHDRNKVTISFVDSGRAFEWPKKGTPDYQRMVATSRQGGLGLVLIERVTDHVHYSRTPTGENELVLTKNFRATRGRGLSLRWRWAVTGMVLSTVAGAVFYLAAANQAETRIRRTFSANWVNFARTAASASAARILSRAADAEFYDLAVGMARPDSSLEYLVLTDARQLVLADTRGPENIHLRHIHPAEIQDGLYDSLQHVSSGTPAFYVISPAVAGGRTVGFVQARVSGASMLAQLQGTRRTLLIFSSAAVVLCWGLSILLSGWLVRPLRRLSGVVQGLARRGVDEIQPERGGDEIQQIIGAFNSAADRIHKTERDHYSRELARREWETAEELQKALVMSEFSGVPGFEIGTLYRSAKYVGGDWFDVFSLDDHSFVVSIADVSGKGVPGALVMATVRTAVRLLAPQHREPATLLSAVHQFVAGNIRAGMFVTMYLVVVDTRAGAITFASAGHTPMLFFRRAEDEVFDLNPRGWPLGMRLPEGASFESRLESGSLPLHEGDIFVLFTDGISEARNDQREFFGVSRLKAIIAGKSRLSAEEISGAIDARVTEFSSDTQPRDDLAAVVVKRTAEVPESNNGRQRIMETGEIEALAPAIDCWKSGETDALTKKLLHVVARHPDFDPPQISLELGREEYQAEQINEQTVRVRLLRLHLDSRANRRRFTAWVNGRSDIPTGEAG
jgi:serine phosphatase RsbU (regulator of sigma subunit)/anti-sigma regulatory factor (Ser/Thr protein kinase)